MGVTLERVQNKFACIIGELCSEPLVLSQFAVWVDLRIAEYKTNGTISLDCSGDFPNPPWMKGMANPKVGVGSKLMDTGQGMYERRGGYTTSSGQLSQQTCVNNRQYPIGSPRLSQNSPQASSSRLSPDVVVIKDEPNLEDQSTCAVSRKRHVDSMDLEFFSSIKSRRLDETDQESSTNQSLMSIINTENDSFTLGHVNADDSGSFRGAMDTVQHAQIELDTSQNSTTVPLSNTAYSPQPPTTSTGSSPSQSAWPSQLNQSAQGNSSQTAASNGNTTESTWNQMFSRSPRSQSASSQRLAQSAVKSFMVWRQKTYPKDKRNIEDLSPPDLDQYLCEFFTTAKRQNGSVYSSNSLFTIRSGIECYLIEKKYSQSILGPAFSKSRRAFKEKQRDLELIRRRTMASMDALSTG